MKQAAAPPELRHVLERIHDTIGGLTQIDCRPEAFDPEQFLKLERFLHEASEDVERLTRSVTG